MPCPFASGEAMRRREFITLVGAGVLWPLLARAQQPERMRRIGVLLPAIADDKEFQAWVGAFQQGLALLGWNIGGNVQIETRWAGGNANDIRRHATELVALAPDVILAHGASTVGPLLQVTRTVPIVFPIVFDPVGAGLVDSLARPGGNVTGFMTTEYSIGGNGWNCLSRSLLALNAWLFFGIPLRLPAPRCSALSRPRLHRSEWR